MNIKTCALVFVLFLTTFISGCTFGSTNEKLPDIDFSTAQALKETHYSRSGYYTNLYPDIDNSQLNILPVYTYCEYTEEMSVKKMTDFCRVLGIDDCADEPYKSDTVNWVAAVFSAVQLQNNNVLSDIFSDVGNEISYTYDSETDSIILEENDREILYSALAKLAETFGYEICNSFDIRKEAVNSLDEAIFSVIVSYSNCDVETERDKLLNYYDLADKLEIQIKVIYGELYQMSIVEYDTECLNMVGEFKVLPANKALKSNTSDKDIYILYILDENGYIRPVYTNQDYYNLGDLLFYELFTEDYQYAEALRY